MRGRRRHTRGHHVAIGRGKEREIGISLSLIAPRKRKAVAVELAGGGGGEAADFIGQEMERGRVRRVFSLIRRDWGDCRASKILPGNLKPPKIFKKRPQDHKRHGNGPKLHQKPPKISRNSSKRSRDTVEGKMTTTARGYPSH